TGRQPRGARRDAIPPAAHSPPELRVSHARESARTPSNVPGTGRPRKTGHWWPCRPAGDRWGMPLDSSPVFFITGCSTGLGRALATHVLERGWRAAVTAR